MAKVEKNFYPIVYVRGFTPSSGSREEAFYDAYYGYSETSVEKRNAPPPNYAEPIVFEGQLIRFLKEYGYVDAANGGLALALSNGAGINQNPTRSLWISRFYDKDVLSDSVRDIVDHAKDLMHLICEKIPQEMEDAGADLGQDRKDYKVIILAHSMGGLVSRCLIQNLMATEEGGNAERWIHRFVTMGSPHGGIELGAVPDFLEDLLAGEANLLNGAIFKEKRMRDYLKLQPKDGGEAPSLQSLNRKYPEGKCLCIIGSDYNSYGVVKRVTGNHSDGLVKQDRAYIKGAYWANVHRAHSGRRGIVNSFETYENVRRFLFGNTKVRMWLENIDLMIKAPTEGITEFFDIEFSLSVRGTGVYLHQRKQNPCENAFRKQRNEFPLRNLHLHTGFLDTSLRPKEDPFSQFLLGFKISQHQVRKGFLFETQFPERTIYSESMDVRVDLSDIDNKVVEFRWLSETIDMTDNKNWLKADSNADIFRFPFRKSDTLTGFFCVQASLWDDQAASVWGEDTFMR